MDECFVIFMGETHMTGRFTFLGAERVKLYPLGSCFSYKWPLSFNVSLIFLSATLVYKF